MAATLKPTLERIAANAPFLAVCPMNPAPPSQLPPNSGPGATEPTRHPIGPSHDALPRGTRFAEYELLSVLGEGRSGIVYLATDHGLERQIAIKEYLPAALASRGKGTEIVLRSHGHAATFALGLESFVNRARLLARFDHPALMRVYRFWEANGTAYMAMPYYEGVTVELARGAMTHPPDEAWLRDLLLPLLDALDVLHGAACHHGNISPQNILLQAHGRPVLLDSGAARHLVADRTDAATVILNPGFAPIEQYAESTQLRQGPWTDLYALAAVAYYCVSGEPPMASTVRAVDDQMEPLFQVVDRIGRSFPDLNYSVAFVSAIERALNVRPQERPQSVAEFRRALLGGRGAADSLGVPSVIEKAKRRATSPPPESPSEETAPFMVSLKAAAVENVEDTARKRAEPWLRETAPNSQTTPERDPRSRLASSGTQTPATGADDGDDAAWRAALDAALSPDGPEFGEFSASEGDTNPQDARGSQRPRRDAKARGGRRALFIGAAAALLVVLGAGGWMMWSDYRGAKAELRSLALGPESDGQPASLLPPMPPATVPPEPTAHRPEPAASVEPDRPATVPPEERPENFATALSARAAAEPPLRSSSNTATDDTATEPVLDQDRSLAEALPERARPNSPTAPAEAAPSEPAGDKQTPVAEPPPRRAPRKSPAVAKEAPPQARLVEEESNNPRVLCGSRTQFSLYRCMKAACDREKYFDHPECKYLRVTDAVRASP